MIRIIKRWPFLAWWLLTLFFLLTTLLVWLLLGDLEYDSGLGSLLFMANIFAGFPVFVAELTIQTVAHSLGLPESSMYRLILFGIWGIVAYGADRTWQSVVLRGKVRRRA